MQQSAVVHFPRMPLFGAATVVFATILIVAAVRLGGIDVAPTFPTNIEPAQTRSLTFADAADGAIIVTDAKTSEQVARAAPGTNGFLRGSLRGLMRVRKVGEASPTAPFILARWPNGQVTLEDTATQVKIDLRAYGPDNLKVFEAFLPREEGVSR